jgi:hypothetical protein
MTMGHGACRRDVTVVSLVHCECVYLCEPNLDIAIESHQSATYK